MNAPKLYLFLVLFPGLWGCMQSTREQLTNASSDPDLPTETTPPFRLNKIWETDTIFTTVESVVFYKPQNLLFASNINGDPTKKDGNGFLSKVTTKGKVVELHWITGLNAPKGMGIYGNRLYVTDIDELVEIDIDKNKIIRRYPVMGAGFLSDIVINRHGTVFFTDSDTDKIHQFKDNMISTWVENADLNGPNGLFVTDRHLLITSMASSDLRSINLVSGKIKTVTDNIGAAHGIMATGKGDYIISNWQGELYHLQADGTKIKILDTKRHNINAADIEYIKEEKLLLVPTFFDNRIMAYRLHQ